MQMLSHDDQPTPPLYYCVRHLNIEPLTADDPHWIMGAMDGCEKQPMMVRRGHDLSGNALRRTSGTGNAQSENAPRRISGTGNAQSGNASASRLGAHETTTPGLGVHDYRSPGAHESMVTGVLESRGPGVHETRGSRDHEYNFRTGNAQSGNGVSGTALSGYAHRPMTGVLGTKYETRSRPKNQVSKTQSEHSEEESEDSIEESKDVQPSGKPPQRLEKYGEHQVGPVQETNIQNTQSFADLAKNVSESSSDLTSNPEDSHELTAEEDLMMENVQRLIAHSRKRVNKVARLARKMAKERILAFKKRHEAGMKDFWTLNRKEYREKKSRASMSTHSKTNKRPRMHVRHEQSECPRRPTSNMLDNSQTSSRRSVLSEQPEDTEPFDHQNLSTINQHVKAIRDNQGIPPDQLREFTDCFHNLKVHTEKNGLCPSVQQFATAAAAYLNMRDNNEMRQVWSQPSGTGKTRTLSALIFILASLGKYKNISVRFANILLKRQDEPDFNNIKAVAKYEGAEVTYKFGVKNLGKGEDAIELIDDCDSLILDGDKFDHINDEIGTIIGLTSAALGNSDHSNERNLLQSLGFYLHDSCIQAMSDIDADLVETTSWDHFFDLQQSTRARLVYFRNLKDKNLKHRLKQVPKDLTVTKFNETLEYRSLEPKTVTLISDKQARGLDFMSADGNGIDLLIAGQVNHLRALEQLFGRVGRSGEPCTLSILDSVPKAINDQKATAFRESIRYRIRTIKAMRRKAKSAKNRQAKKQ